MTAVRAGEQSRCRWALRGESSVRRAGDRGGAATVRVAVATPSSRSTTSVRRLPVRRGVGRWRVVGAVSLTGDGSASRICSVSCARRGDCPRSPLGPTSPMCVVTNDAAGVSHDGRTTSAERGEGTVCGISANTPTRACAPIAPATGPPRARPASSALMRPFITADEAERALSVSGATLRAFGRGAAATTGAARELRPHCAEGRAAAQGHVGKVTTGRGAPHTPSGNAPAVQRGALRGRFDRADERAAHVREDARRASPRQRDRERRNLDRRARRRERIAMTTYGVLRRSASCARPASVPTSDGLTPRDRQYPSGRARGGLLPPPLPLPSATLRPFTAPKVAMIMSR